MSHELHHFSMGMWLFALGWFASAVGCYAGLTCARHATRVARSRARWTFLASVAIGGVGIWLMHFIGMMGFSLPGSPVRYALAPTLLSVALAIGATWFGLWILQADVRRLRSWSPGERLAVGGVVMGLAVAAMHYAGMSAVRVQGELVQQSPYIAGSVLIGVVASLTALWLSGAAESAAMRVVAAAVMASAVVALHYTGMAGVAVHVLPDAPEPTGMTVMSLMFPGFIAGFVVLGAIVLLLLASPSHDDLRAEAEIAAWDSGTPRTSDLH
jgi:NO-binding membrane sensor protein with MHYT domain